jgi:hypothetical protein
LKFYQKHLYIMKTIEFFKYSRSDKIWIKW